MTKQEYLELYDDIKVQSGIEGSGYFIQYYASEDMFDDDLELKELFKNAKKYINDFYELLDRRIEEYGGDPDEFEA